MAAATKLCMTKGCEYKVKTRGVCAKCYGTLRVYVQKGKITWEQAAAAGLCAANGPADNTPPMQAALLAAEEAGKIQIGESAGSPATDPDQEPPVAVAVSAPIVAPPGYYYDQNFQLQSIPHLRMPAPADPSPNAYGQYDPHAPAVADAPYAPRPRAEQPPEPSDPLDATEEEEYLDSETPEQKKRRQQIERRHMKEAEARYFEERGILPPKGGNVVVVPQPIVHNEKNGEIETGHGAGPPEGMKIPPGIYLQRHEQPAQQTIDGEPLLPGWQLAPDGVNLIDPQGRFVDTISRAAAAQQPKQAIILPTNSVPASAQLISGFVNPQTPPPLILPQQQTGPQIVLHGPVILPPQQPIQAAASVTPPWEQKS